MEEVKKSKPQRKPTPEDQQPVYEKVCDYILL